MTRLAPATPSRVHGRVEGEAVWSLDALAVAAVALLLRVPALLASRPLDFNDSVYGASAIAMRHGGVPFRDVFSSQGPLHLPLVFVGDLLAGRATFGPRVAPVAAGVVATVAAYAIGRRITSRVGALVAAGLVATSGSVLWTTGPITADGPTLAAALVAFWLLLRLLDRPGAPRAVALGLAVGAGILCKPALGLVVAVPVVVALVAARRGREAAWAAGAAAVLGLAVSAPFGLGHVWQEAVAYQLHSRREQSMAANVVKVARTLFDRDLALVVALGVTAVAAIVGRRDDVTRPRTVTTSPSPRALLAVWIAAVVVFLVVQPALFRQHVASLVGPLALLLVAFPAPRVWLLAALVCVAPFHVANLWGILHPAPLRGAAAAAERDLRGLPPGTLAISDDPGLVWWAGHRTPPDLVDTSYKRIQQGQITAAGLGRAAAAPGVCAVLVWMPSHFDRLDGLPVVLAAGGYAEAADYGGGRVLYVRTSCRG